MVFHEILAKSQKPLVIFFNMQRIINDVRLDFLSLSKIQLHAPLELIQLDFFIGSIQKIFGLSWQMYPGKQPQTKLVTDRRKPLFK